MAAIVLAKVAVLPGATSAFADTSTSSNIVCGASAKSFKVVYKLGSDIEYEEVATRQGASTVTLVKASSTAIKNTSSTETINVEIWA